MAVIGSVAVNLVARTAALEKGLSNAGGLVAAWASRVTKLTAGVLSVAAVVKFGKEAVAAFVDAEKAASGLLATLRRFGDEAEFAGLTNIATQIELATTFDDESVLRAITRLKQLTGLKGQELKDAIPAAVGLSVLTDSDLNTSFELLAKAVQGNFAPFSKLGVVFNDAATAQEKLNKVIQEGLAAYPIAAARIGTLGGAWDQLKNKINNQMEGVGEGFAQFGLDLLGVFNPAPGAGGLSAPAQAQVKLKRDHEKVVADFAEGSEMLKSLDDRLRHSDVVGGLQLQLQSAVALGLDDKAEKLRREIGLKEELLRIDQEFRESEKIISAATALMPGNEAEQFAMWKREMDSRFAVRDREREMVRELFSDETALSINRRNAFKELASRANEFADSAISDFERVQKSLQEAFDLTALGFLDNETFIAVAQAMAGGLSRGAPAGRLNIGDFSPRSPLALERGGFTSEFIRTATDQLGQLRKIERNTRDKKTTGLTIGA